MTSTRLGCRTFPAHPDDLFRIRNFIRMEGERALLPAGVVGDVILAVSEACANAALHSESARVRVRWEMRNDRIEVDVEDEGVFSARIPIPGDGRGGRGIPLMMALMDEVSIREGNDDAPGTVVRMVKYAA